MSKLTLESISLELPIYNQSSFSMRAALSRFSKNKRFACHEKSVVVRALEDISISLKESDRLGLVGPNGAGKTTLLKVMSKIYKPSFGRMAIIGKVSCILGTGFGMDEEATGYENIFLCGLFLGIRYNEMKKKVDEIVEFTGLNEFIYLPIRTYSAGMRARLSFSISTCYSPEILLMDEGIGAGDAAFFKKAQERLSSFMMNSSILVLASHSNALIKTFCNRAILLDKGKNMLEDSPDVVIDHYMKSI